MSPGRRLKVRSSKPTWWMLYALLPLAAGLLVTAHLASLSLGWREFTEASVSLITMGAIALWLHANRVALILEEHQQDWWGTIDTLGSTTDVDRMDTRSTRREVDSHEDVIAA